MTVFSLLWNRTEQTRSIQVSIWPYFTSTVCVCEFTHGNSTICVSYGTFTPSCIKNTSVWIFEQECPTCLPKLSLGTGLMSTVDWIWAVSGQLRQVVFQYRWRFEQLWLYMFTFLSMWVIISGVQQLTHFEGILNRCIKLVMMNCWLPETQTFLTNCQIHWLSDTEPHPQTTISS